MRPETIKKIIAEGTPKKRVELFYEHYIHRTSGGWLLTKEEETALYEAIIKSERAIQLYKKTERQFNKLREAYHYLIKLYLAFAGAVETIRQKYRSAYYYITDLERAVSILNDLGMSREDRETFVTNFLITEYHIPQFNYKFTVHPEFAVKIELGINQISYINSQKKTAEECLIKARAYYRALDEYMETQKITSKAYKEIFSSLRAKFDKTRIKTEPPLDNDCFKIPLLEEVYFSTPLYEHQKGVLNAP